MSKFIGALRSWWSPPERIFTLEELARFDGTNPDCKAIYISIAGVVYDVSDGSKFYGVGGSYHVLAGHDASFALATMNLDREFKH